ncbi:MAG TPA: hypothetical protein VM287_00155 [Egibacteraceae bacterium]|nr:hypothetical protein [Egibacteraceae bacterium]
MRILRIDHPAPDFDAWKKAFDDDPLGREQSGVRRHRVYRSVDDPNHVWIDLELETDDEAVALRDRLQELWQRVQAQGLIGVPTAHIVEQVEDRQYGA